MYCKNLELVFFYNVTLYVHTSARQTNFLWMYLPTQQNTLVLTFVAKAQSKEVCSSLVQQFAFNPFKTEGHDRHYLDYFQALYYQRLISICKRFQNQVQLYSKVPQSVVAFFVVKIER